MSLGTVSQVNYLPVEFIQYSTKGYASIGVSAAGTFSGGDYFTFQGSNDGNTWSTLPVFSPTANGNSLLADGKVIAAGNYVVNTVNYALIKVVPSNSFASKVTVFADISTRISPAYTAGL